MDLTIRKKALVDVLKKVDRAIENNATNPVLTGVLLVATDEELKITGSNSSLSIVSTVKNKEDDHIEKVAINKDGSVVIPAKEFLSIARSMPEGEISISVGENHQVLIKSGKSNFSLNGMSGEQYPRLPNKIDGKKAKLNGSQLSDALDKTVFAVSKLESRPILTGVHVSCNDNDTLTVVATDSHRLSKVNSIDFEGDKFNGFTLPDKSAKEIARILKNIGEVDIIIIENSQIIFNTENDTIYSRLIDGNFPETNKLIPNSHTTSIEVSREGFLSSIERSSILANSDPNNVVTFEIGGKNENIFETIKLTQRQNELGQSKEDIIVDSVEGEELKISFSADYMIDALKHIDDEKVLINFNSAVQPFTVMGTDSQEEFLQLLLPVRTYG